MAALSLCRRPCAEPRRLGAGFRALTPISAHAAQTTPPRRPPSFESEGGHFRSVIDANAGIEIKHDQTIRAPLKSTASCRSVRSPQRTDGVLLKPSYCAVITHRLHKSILDNWRPRNVDYRRDSPHCFCVVPWFIRNHGEFCARPEIILAQMQAWNINPDALKSGYCLTLRLPMGLAERQQHHDA